jgi:L,D-transpeptidase YbiS
MCHQHTLESSGCPIGPGGLGTNTGVVRSGGPSYPQLPKPLGLILRRLNVQPTKHVLVVSIPSQRMLWLRRAWRPCVGKPLLGSRIRRSISASFGPGPLKPIRNLARSGHGIHHYTVVESFTVSTSRFGFGQRSGSNQTPLGLHRIATKVGGGHLIGTVFEERKPVGFTWRGRPDASIAHRILWLEGLEPGFNRAGNVDSYRRYIYIHGVGNEPGLGKPASCGCIHLSSSNLLPLFDRLPVGTLVWISNSPVHCLLPGPIWQRNYYSSPRSKRASSSRPR